MVRDDAVGTVNHLASVTVIIVVKSRVEWQSSAESSVLLLLMLPCLANSLRSSTAW